MRRLLQQGTYQTHHPAPSTASRAPGHQAPAGMTPGWPGLARTRLQSSTGRGWNSPVSPGIYSADCSRGSASPTGHRQRDSMGCWGSSQVWHC